MEEQIVKLSDAVAKLLSEENKDRSLGEVSELLNEYIIEIKELVDSGGITYDELRNEIYKHIDVDNGIIPGSVSQLLIGCMGDSESCPLKSEMPEDVPFAYDINLKKIIPMSKSTTPITENTYAILYITGDPRRISIDSLKELEHRGFKKLRIEYKEISSINYKKINIDNLEKYIFRQPEKTSFNPLVVLGFIALLFFILYKFRF